MNRSPPVLLGVPLTLLLISASLAFGQAVPNLAITGTVQDKPAPHFSGAGRTAEEWRTAKHCNHRRFGRISFRRSCVRKLPGSDSRRRLQGRHFQVNVGTRSPGRLRIVLSIETLNQQITVSGDTAEVSTDSAENKDVAAVDRQALEALPIFDQDVVATMSRFLDSSALGTNGVAVIVDGMQAPCFPSR